MIYNKFLLLFLVWVFFTNILFGQNIERVDFLNKAISLRFSNPDSAALYFDKVYKNSIKNKDTVNAIKHLLSLSDLYSHNVNYGKSYDGYWEALLLADASKDSVSIASIYQGLGWLYSFYKRDEEALKYFNLSIDIRKKLIKKDNTEEKRDYLQSDYFSVLNLYRVNKNYKKVKIYLDSCIQIDNQRSQNRKSYYLIAESGFVEATEGKFDEGLSKLYEAKTFFEEFDPSYLVIIHSLLGDVYKMMEDNEQGIIHYKKSLKISHDLKRHLNYRLFAYESLSDVYLKQNYIKEAFKYLKLAKERNDQIFGGQSENNKHLLEIKDKYRIEKDKQIHLLDQQRITELEHEEKVSMLKTIILGVTIVFMMLFGYMFFKYLRNKYKNEKRLLTERQKLKLEKNGQILELKNKELTESALRLIEKDEFISGIKNKLENQKDSIDVNVIKRMLKTIQGNPASNWNEFEARFTAINQSFYDKLKNDYPQLSQTDQKICALVKLNFPSKDMAKLLGISVESVHTSRYRLRRKLGLERADNLEEFINKI